jgi:U3 small nucleolar RNA-associated protein 22
MKVLADVNYMSKVRDAISAFEELEHKLKVLSGVERDPAHASPLLPLKLDSLIPVSPYLRYATVIPPSQLSSSDSSEAQTRLMDPLHVLLRFEPSPRWPDELAPLRAAKTAFLITTCEALKKTHRIKSFAHESFADVIVKGFTFRVQIIVDSELSLVDPIDMPRGGHKHKKQQERGGVWGVWRSPLRWRCQVESTCLPNHHSFIHGLAMRHASFPSALRLALRWLHSHRLSDQVSPPSS